LVLPNGSGFGRHRAQFFETEQHGEGPFEFPIEVNLVASETLQLVGIERLAKRLLADQGPVREFLPSRLKARQYLLFDEAVEAFAVRGKGLFIVIQIIGVALQLICPPLLVSSRSAAVAAS
jgi:hypothetical protein